MDDYSLLDVNILIGIWCVFFAVLAYYLTHPLAFMQEGFYGKLYNGPWRFVLILSAFIPATWYVVNSFDIDVFEAFGRLAIIAMFTWGYSAGVSTAYRNWAPKLLVLVYPITLVLVSYLYISCCGFELLEEYHIANGLDYGKPDAFLGLTDILLISVVSSLVLGTFIGALIDDIINR